MANLDSLYDKVLNEAWSKTIAGNGKNTLLVHTEAEFKPEDTYYVFVCQQSRISGRTYAWLTGYRAIDFSVGGNEENWKNLRIIEDRLIKGSDVVSYIKNKENKILSGITQYILDIKYIDPAVKDAIFASLQTNTKSGPGRFEVGFYFVNANIAGQPDLKTYYNIVKTLQDKSKDATLEPIQIAAQTLPYIDDLIKAGELNKKNAELTGGDWNPAGLLEAVNWDDPYPYGKIDSIVTSTIKFYNPDFTDTDVKDAYSAFYGWLQKQEDLPDDMGVQEWYDNAVENFRDADQHERRGMDEDEEAAAEEGYINAAENLLTQRLNAFFNGDSEEYKDFLNARALNKKNAAATGGDWNPAGLLEGLQFDAGSEYFNYIDFCKEQGWSDEEIAEFSKWFATKSDMAEDINDYGDPEDTEAWWKVGSYFDAAIENAGYDAREHQDPTILHDYIIDVKATIAHYYRQYKDYKQAQALNQKNAAATGGDWEPEGLLEGEEICEQATLNPNGELRFGKYKIFQAGSGTQTAPYTQAINDTNLFSKRLADDVKILETFGFKFNTVYYYQPPPRRDGKYVSRAIAISGTDNNGEEILWVRKGGYMAPSPVVYYKDRRGGSVKEIAHDIAIQSKSLTAVSAEDFFKAAVGPAWVSTAGGGYPAKKTKLRPDGKYDVTGDIYLKKDYTRVLVGKPFVINSLDELPIKFGVVRGKLKVKLPVNNVNWFPEKFDGELRFDVESGMLPEKFLELGLLDRVTDGTSIDFETSEKGKYGLNKHITFKSKADWIDTIKAHELNKKNAEITGGDWNPAGLLEATNTEGRVTEFVKTLIEVDNFEDFKRIAKQLPDLSNTINGTPVGLLIQYAIFDNIGPLQGDGNDSKWDSIWYPSTPQDFFYKALYYYIRYHASPNQSLVYRTIPSLEEVERAFNKWLDTKQARDLEKKNAAATGGDWNPAGLLESWTDKDIEDYWEHYYNVGDPGPIGAIKNWPGLSFFNSWFVDMIDRENWNVDSIEDYFIEYSDRVADNLEQKDNEDRGYGELQEIACYRGYKKLYSYYRQFLSDTNSPFYKDWKATEELNKKNAAATGGDWNPAGLLEGINPGPIEKNLIDNFIKLLKKVTTANTFEEFLAAHDGVDPKIWSTDGGRPVFIETFSRFFNVNLYRDKDGKIRGNFAKPDTKFGALYRAVERMGFYTVTVKTNYRHWFHDGTSTKKEYRAKTELELAKKYFDTYKDIIDAEKLDKKNAAATGGDWNPAGLLEQDESTPKKHYFKDFAKHYTDTFITILTKTRDARTFNDFEAAFEGTNPHIWDSSPGNKLFHRTFEDVFKSEPLVKINSNNKYERTKFGHLYEAVGHYGRYFLLSKTDAEKDRFSGEDARSETAFVYKKQAENYFNNYIDIINAEELDKKNVAATGGDWNPAGLLEAYIWKGFPDEYLTDNFTKLIKKAASAKTFEEFLAAHDDVDPKIWSTARAEPFYFKIFQHIFNVDLYKTINGTRGTFIGLDTKLGALYRAIEKMGFYTVAVKTDHNPWHHNAGTKMYRIKSDLESAKKYFDTYKDIVDAEELNKKNVAATGGDWNPAGLLESNGSNKGKWIGFMLKAAEETAKNPKIFAMDSDKAERVPNFWTPVAPSDGTAEGIREAFLSAIKQVQNFDLQNGNFTPGKNTFKRMKYDPNRIGSLPSGYQIYVGDLSSPQIQKELKADLYNKAHRALYSWMEHFAGISRDPQWFTTIGPLPIEFIKDFINGDLRFLKDYLAAKELDKKNAAATGGDWNPAGLLEARNVVFNPKIYDTYKKALEANSFEEFKELIKQLPDPWKYEIMVGGEANARAIIKDILKLKDFPSSYSPKTPADHFLTAVDHIFDVEHSTSVTLDDIRSGYAIAQEHFAKWLDYKKAKELEQKNVGVTGGDWNPAGLLESQEQDNVTPERDKTLFFSTVENFKKYLPEISDADLIGFYDWFNNVKRVELGFRPHAPNNESSWGVFHQITYVAAEDEYGIPEHEIPDEFRSVAEMTMEKLYDEFINSDWYKDYLAAKELDQKNVTATGGDWDPKGLLQEANKVSQYKRFALMKWARTIPNSNEFARQWALKSGFSEADIENFGGQEYLIDGLIDWFVDMEYQGSRIYGTGNLSQEERTALYQKQEDDSVEEVKKHLEELYKDWMAAIELNKKNADVTGGDWNPAGLLEGRIPGGFNNAYFNFNLVLPAGWRETISAFRKWAETVSVHHYKVGTQASDEEYWQSYWDYRLDNWRDELRSQGRDTDMTRIRDRAKEDVKRLYDEFINSDWYKDYLAAKELDQKNVTATGGDWDPKGLLEASTLALKSKEVKNAYLQKFVDLVDEASKCRSFREFEAVIKKTNIEPSGLGHRGEIRSAFRILFGIDTMDSYTLSDNGLNFKNKYGPLFWAINDFLQFNFLKATDKRKFASELNQVIRDVESYFHTYLDYVKAEELDQKNVADTGGDWNPAGLLEAKQYTGPLGPVKDNQGKEHDYQGWYNIIKPFITDLLKAVENNDFSSFVKIVDSRQKNMGGPSFNPYSNLIDKVYAKVLVELLDNEQAENAFDEAYSAVQSIIVYIDLHLEDQWDRDPNTLQSIPHAQIKQEYPRAVATFNKFREIYKDSLDAKELDKKNVADTGGDWNPQGLLEAKPRSTPEEDNFWQNKINEYIDKLVNANTFEEFVGIIEKKPANFQFNPGMYYHDKIFVNAIDSQLGSHDKETGNPVRSSFVAAFSAVQGFVSYVNLFYKKGETTPRLEKDKAAAKKKFDQWLQTRADWYAAQELNKKNAAATGGDWNPAGLLEAKVELKDDRYTVWKELFYHEAEKTLNLSAEEIEKLFLWFLFKATGKRPDQITNYFAARGQLAQLYIIFEAKACDEKNMKYSEGVIATMKLIYNTYLDELKAQKLNQANAAATGGDWDPTGLLESSPYLTAGEESYWNIIIKEWKEKFIKSSIEEVNITEEEANKMYEWFYNNAIKLTSNNGDPLFISNALFVAFANFRKKLNTTDLPEKVLYKTTIKYIYKVYRDEIDSNLLKKQNVAATGNDWDPDGLTESDDELDDITHERYWNNALDATATDWVNSFRSYIGLELANKIYTWMLNKARVRHDSQATYNNLIDMYGKFADERKKKDGLNDWNSPDTAKVVADIVDAYNADKVEQKNAAATGGDWDPKGLL